MNSQAKSGRALTRFAPLTATPISLPLTNSQKHQHHDLALTVSVTYVLT